MRFAPALLITCVAMLAGTAPAAAQSADTAGWNGDFVRALVERARLRRDEPRGDTALRNYSARAAGHVYFYLDRQKSEETTLVKVDQVALELYWAAPNLTKQKIVGLRDESRLPNRMYYHLDHLTVVQNGFGDIIRLGDGDEVRDVPHPAAPDSDSTYDFRLVDSLNIAFPGHPAVRVYQVQVRPKRHDRSAMIGSIFIDRASADIVRMTFTFTPASYVDRRLDYINISLDNGLWSGRYWLPNEQYVEIRRQIPELDFVAGAVIKGRLRVYDYQFNRDLPGNFFFGSPIEAAPRAQREAFAFDEDIFAGLDREGLSAPPSVAALRAQAMELIRQNKLSGLPPLRLHVPNASSVLRFNRAEGTYIGAGASYVPGGPVRYEANGGFATGAGHAAGSLAALFENEAETRVTVRGNANDLRDLGWRSGLPGALNTISSALAADDYLDPYYASGLQVELSRPAGAWRIGLQTAIEQQNSAHLEVSDALFGRASFRPVRPIDEGVLVSGKAALDGPLFTREHHALKADLSLETGAWDGSAYLRPLGILTWTYTAPARNASLMLRANAGVTTEHAPAQKLFLLGGRETLPGYSYRSFTGDAFWLLEFEATRALWGPWIQLRALGALGGVRTPPELPAGWPAASSTTGASVGIGAGLIYDIIRFDLVRGGSNSPRLLFSVKADFWDML